MSTNVSTLVNSTSTTTTVSPDREYCLNEVLTDNDVVLKRIHWFLIPSAILLLILAFWEKRDSSKLGCRWRRPVLVRPFSFLDEPRNRWGIVFAFGSVSSIILQQTLNVFSADFPIWAKIFVVYLYCLETSLICYPLFACMSTRHNLIGAITGLIYSSVWFAFWMVRVVLKGRCTATYVEPVTVEAGAILVPELPVLLFSLLVVLKFIWKLYKHLYKRNFTAAVENQDKLCRGFHKTYVKALFRRHKQTSGYNDGGMTLKDKVIHKLIQPVPGFRFPISILITASTSCIVVYVTASALCIGLLVVSAQIHVHLPDVLDLHLLKAASAIATIITVLSGLQNISLVVLNYRRDMMLLYKGDRSFIPETLRNNSPNSYMAQGVRFIGNSIVGSFWGSIFCFLVMFIPLATMFCVVKKLIDVGKLAEIRFQLEWLIYPACVIIIFQVQVFCVGRYFMQPKMNVHDKHRPLALNNRLAYDVFCFFMVFLNASIGVVQYIKRILVGAILGVFLIARMDKPLLLRGYESMDKCYTNYIGMMLVDVAHNHPVLRLFCHMIQESLEAKARQTELTKGRTYENAVYEDVHIQGIELQADMNTLRNSSRAFKRWMVAVTLLRNPELVQYRVRGNVGDSAVDTVDIDVVEKSTTDSIVSKTSTCECQCCTNISCTLPPNTTTNILLGILLMSCVLIYAGLAILL